VSTELLSFGEGRGWGLSRDRSCAHRERWGQFGFRAVARGRSGCRRSYACSGPIPLPLGGSVVGLALEVSRGPGAPRDRSCARRERWGQLGFRAGARGGSGCRRSYARPGPIPLPLGGSVVGLALEVSRGPGAPRDRSCARRERWGRLGFRAIARGGSGCRRSYARSGPIPLLLGGSAVGLAVEVSRGWGLRGIGPALAGNVGAG